jgi:imidazolonepropionase-like amidohydrolase
MVKAGLSAAEALKTATINPARFLGIEKTDGSIALNKRASLVLLENNPLQNISNSKSIEAVFVNGKFFSKEKLRELLERVKKMMASTGSGISSMAYYPD